MPAISVILPVYNSEEYIAEAVQSILDQTFIDFELLVINDASTDGTLKILECFNDNRLKIINNPVNLKVVKCLNKGLELAQGEFIARMDADDISLPERFRKQVSFFKENPQVDICSTWVYKFGKRSFTVFPAEKHDDLKVSLLFHNVIIHPSVMFRRESLAKHNLQYDETYTNAEDYGLWVEAIDKLTFGTVPEVLLKYRIHDNNVSVQKEANRAVVEEMNYKVFGIFLKRLGVSFTRDQLAINKNLGFRQIKILTPQQLQEHVQWLKTIALANNKAGYFNKKSLQSEVIKNIVFFTRGAINGPWALLKILNFIFSIYNVFEVLNFIPYQVKRRSIFNKRIAMEENAPFTKSALFGINS